MYMSSMYIFVSNTTTIPHLIRTDDDQSADQLPRLAARTSSSSSSSSSEIGAGDSAKKSIIDHATVVIHPRTAKETTVLVANVACTGRREYVGQSKHRPYTQSQYGWHMVRSASYVGHIIDQYANIDTLPSQASHQRAFFRSATLSHHVTSVYTSSYELVDDTTRAPSPISHPGDSFPRAQNNRTLNILDPGSDCLDIIAQTNFRAIKVKRDQWVEYAILRTYRKFARKMAA